MIKHNEQNNLERELFRNTYQVFLQLSITVHHQRKPEQQLKTGTEVESLEGAAYWFAPHDLLSLLIYTPQDQLPSEVTPPEDWALQHQSLIKKMPDRFNYWPMGWRNVLN